MVKNYFLSLCVLLLSAGIIAGCDDDDNDGGGVIPDPTLSVAPGELPDVPASGTEYKVMVKSNTGWTVTGLPDWIELSADKGAGDERITVTILPNTSAARDATIIFSADTQQQTVTISQTALSVPAPAGNILGEDSSDSPIELRIREIEGAETYRWYRGDVALQHGLSRTFRVTESGLYSVAGVNAAGEGLKSPVKDIYITPEDELFINKLVGTWKSTGILVDATNTYYDHIHTMEVTRKDMTTIEISDFLGVEDQGYANVVTAEVDNTAKTIMIKHPQEILPSWVPDQNRVFVSPLIVNNPKTANYGLSFPPIPVEEDENGVLGLELYAGGEFTQIGGINYYGSYTVLLTNLGATAAEQTFMYVLGAVWEKL